MTRRDGAILVLWGAQFDEAPAAIFITAFREAGWRVKVVGLHGQHITGAYGVTLTPDIYLDEALRLAPQTICLIIPTTLRMLDQFSHDPRLHQLLTAAQQHGVMIVLSENGARPAPQIGSALVGVHEFAAGEGIFQSTRTILRELSGTTPGSDNSSPTPSSDLES